MDLLVSIQMHNLYAVTQIDASNVLMTVFCTQNIIDGINWIGSGHNSHMIVLLENAIASADWLNRACKE